MNTVSTIRAVHTPTQSAATIARRKYNEKRAAQDARERELLTSKANAQAELASWQKPTHERADMETQLIEVIAARLSGAPCIGDETDLKARIVAKSLEIKSLAPLVRGAAIAIERIDMQIAELVRGRTTDAEELRAVQFAEAVERLDSLAVKGEHIAAQFDGFITEMTAAAICRDHLRPLSIEPCAHRLRVKYSLPAPLGLASFDGLAATRDIGPDVQRRAAEILAELGADPGNIR